MKWAFGLIRRSKKKSLLIFKFEGVKVVVINDYNNRRVLVFYYKESTKQLFRVAYHGYYLKMLRKKIVLAVEGIQNSEEYFDKVIKSRRSYSYKRERAFKRYITYKK